MSRLSKLVKMSLPVATAVTLLIAACASETEDVAQMTPQYPSPMQENTRVHDRLSLSDPVMGISLKDLLPGEVQILSVADPNVHSDAPLVIHNADFDMNFLNAELDRLGRSPLVRDRAIDTVTMARRKFPGAQASLDALCRRFEIDNSTRSLHGALLDAQLLSEVYLELIGGRQPGLELAATEAATAAIATGTPRPARPHAPSAEESERHTAFVETLTDPIWKRSD